MICPHCHKEIIVPDDLAPTCPACGKDLYPPDIPIAEATLTLWSEARVDDYSPSATIKMTGRPGPYSHESVRPRVLAGQGAATPGESDFELMDLLGEGGMGEVYRANQASMNRVVAVKLIKQGQAHNDMARTLFLSEAAITGRLDHPNIIPVYELGKTQEGVLFYAMKFARGVFWHEVIGEKSEAENLDILLRVADAVAFAHDHDVIHRDLKPANILLGDYGEVLVMDWGLAMSVAGDKPADQTSVCGTPAYMPPEMAEGHIPRINKASDIYLLGAILYEIISGRPPHARKSARSSLASAVRNRIPGVLTHSELSAIALKAMATNPDDRFRTVKDFQEAIRDYQTHAASIVMAGKAQEDFDKARISGDYEHYAKAVHGFQEALGFWNDNEAARRGLAEAYRLYTECAINRGDLDLAGSVSAKDPDTSSRYAARIRNALAERDQRKRLIRRLKRTTGTLATVAGLILLVSFLLVRHEKTQAERARDMAVEEREKAEAAEQLALEQREMAEEAEAHAVEQRQKAEESEARATMQFERAQLEHYAGLINMADRKIRDRDMSGLSDIINAIDFLPKHLRSWEWDRINYIANMEQFLIKHTFFWQSLLLSPDNSTIVIAGSHRDGIRGLSMANGSVVFHLEPESHSFRPHRVTRLIAMSDDNCLIAANSAFLENEEVRVWDTQTSNIIFSAITGNSPLQSLAINGNRLLAVDEDGKVALWDIESSNLVSRYTLAMPNGGRRNILAGKNPSVLVDIHAAETATIWNAETAEPLRDVDILAGFIWRTVMSYDGDWFALIRLSTERLVLINLMSGEELFRFPEIDSAINAIAISALNKVAATGHRNGMVALWDIKSNAIHRKFWGHEGEIEGIAVSSDGRQVVTLARDDSIRVWDVEQLHEPELIYTGFTWVLSGKDHKMLLTKRSGAPVQIWDTSKSRLLSTIPHLDDRQGLMALSQDGQKLVTLHPASHIQLWDTATGTVLHSAPWTNGFGIVSFAPDNKQVAISHGQGLIDLWHPDDSWQTLNSYEVSSRGRITPFRSIFGPDARELLVMGLRGQLGIYNLKTNVWSSNPVSDGTPTDAVSSTSGEQVAIGYYDGLLEMFHIEPWRGSWQHHGDRNPIRALTFSPDEKRILLGSQSGWTRLLDSRTGRQFLSLATEESRSIIHWQTFAPDQSAVLAQHFDSVTLWPSKRRDEDPFWVYWDNILGAINREAGVSWHPQPAAPGTPLTIYYDNSAGPLFGQTNMWIHLGHNHWQRDIRHLPMISTTGGFAITVDIPEDADTVDFVFASKPQGDPRIIWDNNNQQDWHIPVVRNPGF